MNAILEYISSQRELKDFFDHFVKNRDISYSCHDLNRLQFLDMFMVRYEINHEINKMELCGAKELISKLKKALFEEFSCHTFKYKNNEVSVFTDTANSYFLGYLLVKDGKMSGKKVDSRLRDDFTI